MNSYIMLVKTFILVGLFAVSVSSEGKPLQNDEIKEIIESYAIKKKPDFSINKTADIDSNKIKVRKDIYKKKIGDEYVVAKEAYYYRDKNNLIYEKINVYDESRNYLYSFWLDGDNNIYKYKIREDKPLTHTDNLPIVRYSYTTYDAKNNPLEEECWKIIINHEKKTANFTYVRKNSDGETIEKRSGDANYDEYRDVK